MIQGFGDDEKYFILTQSPTIQRASQRLLMAISPALLRLLKTRGIKICLRDITQAYTQSGTELNRLILAGLLEEIHD